MQRHIYLGEKGRQYLSKNIRKFLKKIVKFRIQFALLNAQATH